MLLFERLLAIVFVLFIVTQVVLPPFISKPFFFIFRPWLQKKNVIAQANEHRREAQAELEAAKAEAEAIRLRREAEKLRLRVMEEMIDDGAYSENSSTAETEITAKHAKKL